MNLNVIYNKRNHGSLQNKKIFFEKSAWTCAQSSYVSLSSLSARAKDVIVFICVSLLAMSVSTFLNNEENT